jgi:hypothetical protein
LVIFFESGRLGNQLLQYAVLRDRFAGQRLLFFGCDSLRAAVQCEQTWFVPLRARWRLATGLLRRVLERLAAVGLIGEGQERRDGVRCWFDVQRGLVPAIVLVRPSYFLHPAFERSILEVLELDAVALRAAGEFVTQHSAGRPAVFLHVRRGDYLSFPSPQEAAALSADWILGALGRLRASVPQAMVFACTDDPAWVRGLLAGAADVVHCDRGELGDLAVLATCVGGVLSPSSFSWCGALLAHRTLLAQGRAGIFIAPRYWVGHRRGQWYPAGFEFPWITYL